MVLFSQPCLEVVRLVYPNNAGLSVQCQFTSFLVFF